MTSLLDIEIPFINQQIISLPFYLYEHLELD